MNKILITGATGNIGTEVIEYLHQLGGENQVFVAARSIENATSHFSHLPQLSMRSFDFENQNTFDAAFEGIDILFLLRPPHISEVEKYFQPLLTSAQKNGIEKVVFLSVQGAEKSKVIPHNKIERLIQSYQFKYIFVRPSYFMQNLTTTLLPEIRDHQCIVLPSGNAKFNWIDVKNIGEATAQLIMKFDLHQNQAYEITGIENKSFKEVAHVLTQVVGKPIQFKSINPIRFYFKKKREGTQSGFAMVMTILHFLPRFQPEPTVTNTYEKLTGKAPIQLQAFIEREKNKFT